MEHGGQRVDQALGSGVVEAHDDADQAALLAAAAPVQELIPLGHAFDRQVEERDGLATDLVDQAMPQAVGDQRQAAALEEQRLASVGFQPHPSGGHDV